MGVELARQEHQRRPDQRRVQQQIRRSALQVGRVDDPAEARADAFADLIEGARHAGWPSDAAERPGRVRRAQARVDAAPPAAAGSSRVRRATSNPRDPLGGTTVDPTTAARIHSASGGIGVPDEVRRSAEEASGLDLGAVRIHQSNESAALSSSLQAAAFTVGTDIFLGADAAPPGTTAGNRLLAHELGHVVDEGGGSTVGRVRRRVWDAGPNLEAGGPSSGAGSPSDAAGRPSRIRRSTARVDHTTSPAPADTGTTVRRLFGKKKGKQVTTAEGNVEVSNGLSKSDKAERKRGRKGGNDDLKAIQKEIAHLESALKRLVKWAPMESKWTAAEHVSKKATAILASLPGAESKKAQALLGVTLPDERRRLDHIVAEAELIVDERRVDRSKKQAEEIYMQSGRDSRGDGVAGAFTKLTGAAYAGGFNEDPTENTKEAKRGREVKPAGLALGLSPAEIAAIYTFTAEDYKYINPATANSDSWMKASRPELAGDGELDDEEQQRLANELRLAKEEGALHAAMAIQGLNKLPVYSGLGYRGESLKPAEFAKRFREVPSEVEGGERRFEPVTKEIKREALSSVSKSVGVAHIFIWNSGKGAPENYGIIWEYELINGREVHQISNVEEELEIMTFPGATFRVESIRVDGEVPGKGNLVVRCTQVK